MTVQHHIDIVRRLVGRNVLQSKFQTVSNKVDHQRPLPVAVAIAPNDRDRRTNRPQFVQNGLVTNVAQVPNLICETGQLRQLFREFIVSIGQYENFHLTNRVSHNEHDGYKDRYLNLVVTLVAFVRGLILKNVIQ